MNKEKALELAVELLKHDEFGDPIKKAKAALEVSELFLERCSVTSGYKYSNGVLVCYDTVTETWEPVPSTTGNINIAE